MAGRLELLLGETREQRPSETEFVAIARQTIDPKAARRIFELTAELEQQARDMEQGEERRLSWRDKADGPRQTTALDQSGSRQRRKAWRPAFITNTTTLRLIPKAALVGSGKV
jgi:hypothetical protein